MKGARLGFRRGGDSPGRERNRRSDVALAVDLDELHPLRDDAAVAGAIGPCVLDGVFEEEQRAGLVAFVVSSTRIAPRFRRSRCALDDQVERGVEQRVAGADEGGERLAWKADQALSKVIRS